LTHRASGLHGIELDGAEVGLLVSGERYARRFGVVG